MTHVKNVEAFTRLIGFCSGYEGKYNPGRPNLQIEALVNQLNEATSAMELAKAARTELDNEVNQRKQAFDQLPRLVSSILRTLEASGARPEKLDDARAFAHQLLGMSPKNRAPLPSDQTDKAKAKVQRKHMQLAYASKVDTFSKLVQSVSSEPLYQPREPEFNQAGLEDKVKMLNELNQHVADARGKWSKTLIDRNNLMYVQEASMIETAQAVKKYVRAIFGHDSQEYALVKALTFTKQMK